MSGSSIPPGLWASDRRRESRRAETLAEIADDLTTIEAEWHALVAVLSHAQLNWRAAPNSWSVGEHLAHLNLVDASYLPYLDTMLARGRAAGCVARHTPRHPWIGWYLARHTLPPVKLKVRTARPFVPASAVRSDVAQSEFTRVRAALRERIAAAAGLDVGRMRARYAPGIGPAKLVVLSFAQWLAVLAAHDRRHLWLAERVIDAPGFPMG